MLTSFSLQIDPSDVLGVAPDATLEQIRDAYRAKAKKHHPDAGGEEWAFRVVAQAYEVMSTARVAHASDRESKAPPRPQPAAAPSTKGNAAATTGHHFGAAMESVRRGVQEGGDDGTHVVDVERLSIRYQPEGIWLITERADEDRMLSCCLNVTWPSNSLGPSTAPTEATEQVLRELGQVFDAVDVHSKASASSASVVGARFSGWLSYPTGEQASEGFNQLRKALHDAGLAVNQWSRDLVIPRHWR